MIAPTQKEKENWLYKNIFLLFCSSLTTAKISSCMDVWKARADGNFLNCTLSLANCFFFFRSLQTEVSRVKIWCKIRKNYPTVHHLTSIWAWRNLIYPIASDKTEAVSVCKRETCHNTHIVISYRVFSISKDKPDGKGR